MKDNIIKIKELLKDKVIHLVPYSHCDYSWVHTRIWHINRYITIMKEVLDILETTEEYQYCTDCYSLFLEPVFERHPEMVEGLQKHVKSGRFIFCGTYSNVRPNMVEGEAFIRNMVLGRRYFLQKFPDAEIIVYGDPCDVAASHTQLPQLIKNGGYDFFRFGRPGDVLTLKGIPHDFIFKGLDGTSIISSMAAFGGLWNRDTVPALFDDDMEKSICALYNIELKELLPKFSSNILLLGDGCDDAIPLQYYHPSGRTPLMEQIVKYRDAGINIRFSNPNLYFLELNKKENKEKLTVIDYCYDIADVSFNICLGGEQSLQNKRLKGAQAIVSSEKLDASEYLMQIKDENVQNFNKLWEENLFCSGHASQWSYSEDYDDLTMRANRVMDRAKESRENSYLNITRNQEFCDSTVAVVFNSHDKTVRRAIKLTITTPDPAKLELMDAFGHFLTFMPIHPYVFPFMETSVSEWDFMVTIDIPPNGYNSIIATKGRLDVIDRMMWEDIDPNLPQHLNLSEMNSFEIENKVLKLGFENGGLKEIFDKRINKGVKNENSYNELRFYEYSDAIIAHPVYEIKKVHHIVWESCTILFNTETYTKLIVVGKVKDHTVRQTITLNNDLAEIHFETEVLFKENDDGFMLFNIPCNDIETLNAGIPFGIEPRRVDKEPYLNDEFSKAWDDIGCQHRTIDGLFFAKDFITFKNENLKLSLIAQTGDRYYVYNRKDKTVGHIVNATSKIESGWEENINKTAFSCYGKHIFNHVISVFNEAEELYEIQQNAEGLCLPVEYVRPLSGGIKPFLPMGMSFLSVKADNVRISAFYKDDDGYVIRLWEASKKETASELVLPVRIRSVQQTDFNGKHIPNDNLVLMNGVVHFIMNPSQIMTLKMIPEFENCF